MNDLIQLAANQKLEFLEPDTTVAEAAKKMSELRVGSMLILDGNELKGIFTERDLMNRVVSQGKDYKTTKIKEVMSTKLVVVNQHETIPNCYHLMQKKKCRHLPILDDNNKVIGMVSIRDLLSWMYRDLEIENEELKKYIQT